MSAEPAGHVDTEKEPVDAGLDPTDVIRSPESGSGERIAPPDPLREYLALVEASQSVVDDLAAQTNTPRHLLRGRADVTANLIRRLLDLEARLDSIEDHLAASATDLVQRIMAAKEEA